MRVYRVSNPEQPQAHHRGDAVKAEPALPGWVMTVDDLFRCERAFIQIFI